MGRKLTLENDNCKISVELYEWNGFECSRYYLEEYFRDVLRGLGYHLDDGDDMPDLDGFYDSTTEDE